MTVITDIPDETPPSQTERDSGREGVTKRRKIGPESEDRGGREAPEETLGQDTGYVISPERGSPTKA